jgi:hypothetical protein
VPLPRYQHGFDVVYDTPHLIRRHPSQTFLKTPVGWSVAEDAEDNDDGAAKPAYTVIGSLGGRVDAGFAAPALAETVADKRDAMAAALEHCDLVVFPILDSEAEADDASWAVQCAWSRSLACSFPAYSYSQKTHVRRPRRPPGGPAQDICAAFKCADVGQNQVFGPGV